MTLTLIRGLPGSGKSNLAKSMNGLHIEADMFFHHQDEIYSIDDERIKEAHERCQRECELQLSRGNDVIVTNTFIKHQEMDVYRKLARKYKVNLSINTCITQSAKTIQIESKAMKKMRQSWEP